MGRIWDDAKAVATRWRRWRRAAGHAAAARRACALARPARLEGAVEPLALGDADAARRLAAGEVALRGAALWTEGRSPFAPTPPTPAFRDALHGFVWLDCVHAAAKPDRAVLAEWVFDWLRRHGGGGGPGWTPEIAGRRAARLAAAAGLLAADAPHRRRKRLAQTLRAHALFLAARGALAETALGRLEAATGLALAALVDSGSGRLLTRGIARLGAAAAETIDAQGAVASRNPDELAAAFELLAWTAHALTEARRDADSRHLQALARAGPVLRALRLGDGSLARFHGGRGGADVELDQAFALAGRRGRGPRREEAMGYARLAAGGTVVVLDAAPPPPGPLGAASALGVEISVGRRLMTGAIGCGARLGGEWAVAARATAAHCSLEVDGASCGRLAPEGFAARTFGRPLGAGPRHVAAERLTDARGHWLRASHDGYRERFGLIVARRLNLAAGGARLSGEDTAEAPDAEARQRFDRAAREGGLPLVVRFHLPPEAQVEMLADGAARVTLDARESWTLSAVAGALKLEDSVWIAPDAAAPARSCQLAIVGRAEAYWGRVAWRIERAPQSPAPEPSLARALWASQT
ncbi:MAG: heparinase II/III family protein [Rubrimonas sp.]|uniref:heparinase II/III domain-containing protein n=1 Tax=Rubrimonas sp. TaxID=2036015 RepID=UPI002FDDC958